MIYKMVPSDIKDQSVWSQVCHPGGDKAGLLRQASSYMASFSQVLLLLPGPPLSLQLPSTLLPSFITSYIAPPSFLAASKG